VRRCRFLDRGDEGVGLHWGVDLPTKLAMGYGMWDVRGAAL
jgi:hypothetical protein